MSTLDLAHMPPLLIPAPRRVEHVGGAPVTMPNPVYIAGGNPDIIDHCLGHLVAWRPSSSADLPWLHCQVDAALGGHEHYVLTILNRAPGQPKAQISASDEQGLRHGLHTLAQLIRQYRDHLPALRIDDQPVFAVRGAMLDVSRDRVPTEAELRRIVDQLAALKLNHLQLYTEHTFAYHGHSEVWENASPLTPREIADLDHYAAARGINLVANQNCFGHLERWLKLPRYAPLAETTSWTGWGKQFNYPFSLTPGDPGSIALIDDLLGQLLPCFSTKLVNIGCDETLDIGQGRSKAEVERRGRADVYLEFVNKVCALARTHGYRPAFWADIALEHPEALAQLPNDVITLAWGYEPDSPFATWCSQLKSGGHETWVCPGTSSWCSITGRTSERRANLLAAARDGAAGGAVGYLITDWGDYGHRQQWPVALVGLAEGAHRAWSGVEDYDSDASSLHVFGDRSLQLADWLDALGDADANLRRAAGTDGGPLRNRSALFTDLHTPLNQAWHGDYGEWKEVAGVIAALAPPDPLVSGLDHQLWRECRHTWRVAEFAATRAVCRRSTETHSAYKTLAATLRNLMEEHRQLWFLRSRRGGLDDSCAHYQKLIDELEQA